MHKKQILLVEDNPSDIELVRRALTKGEFGGDLVIARDGQEALDHLFGAGAGTARPPARPPALILLDLHLPKVDGWSVLQRIKGDPRTRHVPTVILAASGESGEVRSAYELGANGFVRKPTDSGEFIEAVGQLSLYWVTVNQPFPEAI